MIQVEAVLFDLDGTLIDSKRDLFLAVRHVQAALGLKPSTERQVASFIGDGVLRLIERSMPDLPRARRAEAVSLLKRYYTRHCLDHTRLYPGVKEALRRLHGKSLAVVTNKPAGISRRILKGLGIASRFRLVVGGDTLGRRKPDPHPVRYALRRMRVRSPRRAVTVGDSVNDVVAGRRAGTWTCAVVSNITQPKIVRKSRPDFMILNLRKLHRLFN